MSVDWLEEVRWDGNGLVTAVAQEIGTNQVLMVAWMNREALRLSVDEGQAVYWSRSRQRLWRKGEESGHRQKIHDIRLDCDGDVILLLVEQAGGIACHTGRRHCFYRQLRGSEDRGQRIEDGSMLEWHAVEPVLKDPKTIYSSS